MLLRFCQFYDHRWCESVNILLGFKLLHPGWIIVIEPVPCRCQDRISEQNKTGICEGLVDGLVQPI
jgi:hypothetical protein